jgi:signal transduction histidine kinase
MDIRFRHRNGHEVWTLLSARPTYDNAGHFVGAIDLFTDITERRRAEQAAIAADRTKDEFLAVLSHELRNPIAPILTAVRLLQLKGPQDPALQKLRATIERQTEHLSRLIGDLMDVGAIMSGKLHLDRHPADLNAILKQAVETTIPLIERRKHALRVIASESPIYVDVDAARIVQVVANILNNAAKYMQEGGVIEVLATFREGSGVVRIRDQGVGIAPEMLDRIFQKYVQVDSSRHRAQGGLGIGLALVKAIVELHGGSVEAHSEGIGRGSEFVVRLPVVSVEAVST